MREIKFRAWSRSIKGMVNWQEDKMSVYSLSSSGRLMARLLQSPVDISFRDEIINLFYEYCRRKGTREILLEQDFFEVATMIMDFKAKYDEALKRRTK